MRCFVIEAPLSCVSLFFHAFSLYKSLQGSNVPSLKSRGLISSTLVYILGNQFDSRRRDERPLDGRFMSRLTGCAFCRGSGNITPSRVRQGVTSISLSYRVNARSAPVAKAGSTISWLNRLINGSRGGSWLICITLAVSQPVQAAPY